MKKLIKKYGWNKLSILLFLILIDILLVHNMYNGIIPRLENVFAVLVVLVHNMYNGIIPRLENVFAVLVVLVNIIRDINNRM